MVQAIAQLKSLEQNRARGIFMIMDKAVSQKIVFVAGLHGNETASIKALTENNINFILGNPRAYEQNLRFTEKDLNASFGLPDDSYESRRAKEILEEIDKDALVVDFHTTGKEDRPFVIIVDKKMISLAKRTGIQRVVMMKHNIKKGHALINYRGGVSVETGTYQSEKSYQTTLMVVENILSGKKHPITLYEVYDEIREAGNYKNFKIHKNGFIPILANEPEYEQQGLFGLKARKL